MVHRILDVRNIVQETLGVRVSPEQADLILTRLEGLQTSQENSVLIKLTNQVYDLKQAIRPALKWMNKNQAPQSLCDDLQAVLIAMPVKE